MAVVSLLTLWLAPAAWADCPEALSARAVIDHVDRAERAYAALDGQAFLDGVAALDQALPCVGEPLSPSVSARVHRVQGLHALSGQDLASAAEAFGAARRLAPDYALPTSLVPEGHPTRQAYDSTSGEVARWEAVETPAWGSVRLDGGDGTQRPVGQAVIYQWVHPDGQVVRTAYLWSRDVWPTPPHQPEAAPTPAEPTPAEPEPAAEEPSTAQPLDVPPEVPPPEEASSGRHRLWGGLAAAAAVGAVTLGAVSYTRHQTFTAEPRYESDEDDQQLYTVNRLTYGGMWIAGAASVGLGAVAVVSWRF